MFPEDIAPIEKQYAHKAGAQEVRIYADRLPKVHVISFSFPGPAYRYTRPQLHSKTKSETKRGAAIVYRCYLTW